MAKKVSSCGCLLVVVIGVIVGIFVLVSRQDTSQSAKSPQGQATKPETEAPESNVKFEVAGYYKSDDRHRIFAYYPSKVLDNESISEDIWDKIVQVGLGEMHTKGRTTRVFFYLDETAALKARLSQHSSFDAALQGAYYAKPFASVETMNNGETWFTKYPETLKEEVIKLQ